MLIDSHCHLSSDVFEKNREQIIKNCLNKNIYIINCAVNFEDSLKSIELSKKYKNVYSAIGIDPQEISKDKKNFYKLEKLIKENQKHIIAIGEIGLEFFKCTNFKEQIFYFKKQIQIANKYNLPIIIHCRDFDSNKNRAFDTLIKILQKIQVKKKGVVHSFGGDLKYAKMLIDLGFYIGVNGIITFDKTKKLREIVKVVGLENILLETDSPYLAPVPKRGKTNQPDFIVYIVRFLENLLQIDYNTIVEQTTINCKKLFNI